VKKLLIALVIAAILTAVVLAEGASAAPPCTLSYCAQPQFRGE